MMAGFDPHTVCARCRDKKKGSDPCTETPPAPCSHCDSLTSEQKNQLSTPSSKLKKEKKEAKSSTPVKNPDSLSPTLVDPALVSLVGVVDGQTTSGLSGPVEKKAKKMDSKKSSSSSSSSKPAKAEKSVKSSTSRPPAASSTDQGKSSSSSTNARFSELDKKWSDRFNRLEALLLAKTVDQPQQPVFSTVKVTPSHAPPANVVRPDPFLKPAPQTSQPTDPVVDSPATDSSLHRPTTKVSSSAQPEPNTETVQRKLASAFDTSRKESLSSSDSDSDSLIRSTPLGYSTGRR